jgi:hypothetical protein
MSDLLTLFTRRPRGPSAGSLLLGSLRSPASSQMNGLQAYWRLEEASGLRFDSISNGDGPAARFVRASSQRLSIADNAALSMGTGVSCSIGCFGYLDNLTNEQAFLGKFDTTGNQRGYVLRYRSASTEFRVDWSPDGTSATQKTISSLVAPAAGQWYHLLFVYDATAAAASFYLNNVLQGTLAETVGVFDNTAAFIIGAYLTGTFANLDGRVARAGVWKRVLTAAERAEYYNDGRGKRYVNLSPGLASGLVGWWDLTEYSGDRADGAGANTLTATGTPLVAGGPFGNTLTDANTVTANTGKVGTAAEFVIANSEQLVAGDSPELRGGDSPWEISGWFRLAATATNQTLMSKDTGAAAGREYRLDFLTATAKLSWIVYDGTNIVGTVTTTGTFSANTFYHVRVYHDSVGDKVGIAIDGAAAEEAATTGAPSAGTASAFRLGANGSGTPQFFGGRLDEWGKRNRISTAAEAAADYAGGAGLAYPKGGGVL